MTTFSNEDKQKALVIVRIFETSRVKGNYSACVVLNDGAGISFGAYQFTHRSGSLAAVVSNYLDRGGQIGRDVLPAALPDLFDTRPASVNSLSSDERLKRTLRLAGGTSEMRAAQDETAADLYLKPAIDICHRFGFGEPLSLAVVYDSVVHGNWQMIAGRVSAAKGETEWITEYVRKRHFWLSNAARLRVTAYRTRFFLDQIAIANWQLRLPLTIRGIRFTSLDLVDETVTAGAVTRSSPTAIDPQEPDVSINQNLPEISSRPPYFEQVIEKFDRGEGAVSSILARTDRARSVWAAVGGTVWQTVWAAIGWLAGVPKEVWITVAVIAGILSALYLYRQIALGKIRESRSA